MNSKALIVSVFIFLTHFPSATFSQFTLNGKVEDASSKEVLTYVNIGIPGKDIGTLSNEEGKFSLFIPLENTEDSLRFGSIGYHPMDLALKSISLQLQNELIISLIESPVVLETVIIPDRKLKEIQLGNKTTSSKMMGGFSSNDLGSEIGIPIKVKNSPIHIKTFEASIVKNSFGPIKFKLNFYSLKKGFPDKLLNTEPIFVSFSKEKGILTIDLQEKNIWMDEDFFVSLEWIDDHDGDGLMFSLALFGKPLMERKTSMGNWNKMAPISPGFKIIGEY